MIFLHDNLLDGSGSNLWIKAILKALCKNGHTVHILCQEYHPEIYDFISTVYKYNKNKIEKTLSRQVPYSGECIMHKPIIGDVLPVYVEDIYEEFKKVIPIVKLEDNVISGYIKFNAEIANYIVKKYKIKSIYANNAVLMSMVALNVAKRNNINYFVMPHSDSIENAVNKQERLYNFAKNAFEEAKKIFVISNEMKQKVKKIFFGDINIEDKIEILNLGVDTSVFNLRVNDKASMIMKLEKNILNNENGNNDLFVTRMLKKISDDISKKEIIEIIKKYNIYNNKVADLDIVQKISKIDFENDKIVISIGKLISNKGMHTVIAALPLILKQNPNIKLLIVGNGPLREVMEIMLFALRYGYIELFEHIIEWGSELEFVEGKYQELEEFYKQLQIIDMKDEYFEAAQTYLKEDSVIFTGYLTHNSLQYILPFANVAVFPYLNAEIGPLVFLESMASGCYPIGTMIGEVEHMILEASEVMKSIDRDWMKIKAKKESIVSDLIRNIPKALEVSSKYKNQLNKIVLEKYDWNIVAKKLIDIINNS